MINKVIIVGYIGRDPETTYTTSGTRVCKFSVATSERWKDQSGQQQEATEWHRVITWNRLAEICGEYLRKGSLVYVEGKLTTRKWQDQSGNDRYTTEIVAREMKKFGGKNEQHGGNGNRPSGGRENSDNDVPF